MADITDPSAIKFSNELMRPAADRAMQLYWLAKQISSDWTSKGMGALIPNDQSPVIDGSATDGRTPITGADLNILLAHLNTYIGNMEANNNLMRNQIQKIAVNEIL